MTVLRLVTLALTVLILIPSGAHLFELPAKMALERDPYFTVQAIYAGWAWFAIPIAAALVLNGVLFVLELRRDRRAAAFAAFAVVLILISLATFFAWIFPGNQATENWTVMPENWQGLRQRWEYGHAASALILFSAALSTGRAVVRTDP